MDLLQDSHAKEFTVVFPEIERRREQMLPLLERAIREDDGPPAAGEAEKDRRAERLAKAATALFRLGARDQVWSLLAHSSDPRVRSFLIHWLTRVGDEPGVVLGCLQKIDSAALEQAAAGNRDQQHPANDPNRSSLFDRDTSIRRALILIIGHFDPEHLSKEVSAQAIQKLLDIYRHNPDPGVHGAARWALGHWRESTQLGEIDSALAKIKATDDGRWWVNAAGQTMVRINGPLKFQMGAPASDPDYHAEIQHERTIPRRFAIAATEVSIGQFDEFWKQHPGDFPKAKFRPGSQDLREAASPGTWRRPTATG